MKLSNCFSYWICSQTPHPQRRREDILFSGLCLPCSNASKDLWLSPDSCLISHLYHATWCLKQITKNAPYLTLNEVSSRSQCPNKWKEKYQRWPPFPQPPFHDGNRSQPHLEPSKAEKFSDQLDRRIPVMRQRMGGEHPGAWTSQPHQELQSFPFTRNCRWDNVCACGPCGMNSSFLHTQILFVVPLHSLERLFLCGAFVHYVAWSWRALGSGLWALVVLHPEVLHLQVCLLNSLW